MTKLEKKTLAGVAAFLFIVFYLLVSINSYIDDHGGIKGLIIEAGREIKDIAHEIEKE